jgi:hypothetical protein
MLINIKIEGLEQVQRQLGEAAKQATYAASRALTSSAYAINDALKKAMSDTFKGGATAYTLRAFSVTKATKSTLTATVALRTDAPSGGTAYFKALAHMFTGGQRRYKRLEGWLLAHKIMPNGLMVAPGAGMPLDRFGNMRQSALTEMLGVLGTLRTNMRVFRRTGAGKAQKATGYFVVQPGNPRGSFPGVYKRIEAGASSTISPMLLFVDPVTYRRFIDLDKLGREVVAKTFQPAFDAELARALANAK